MAESSREPGTKTSRPPASLITNPSPFRVTGESDPQVDLVRNGVSLALHPVDASRRFHLLKEVPKGSVTLARDIRGLSRVPSPSAGLFGSLLRALWDAVFRCLGRHGPGVGGGTRRPTARVLKRPGTRMNRSVGSVWPAIPSRPDTRASTALSRWLARITPIIPVEL